jgi:hypothetical protein
MFNPNLRFGMPRELFDLSFDKLYILGSVNFKHIYIKTNNNLQKHNDWATRTPLHNNGSICRIVSTLAPV